MEKKVFAAKANEITAIKEQVIDYCTHAASIGIMSHINPDGDGFAASLALKRYLQCKSISAEIIVDKMEFEKFDYLLGDIPLTIYNPQQSYDLLLILDCNSPVRLGERQHLIEKAKHLILIDHHENEGKLIPHDFAYIGTEHVSTGVILFIALADDIESLGAADKKYIAECIYTTILNDTNNFCNLNTNAEVFQVAASLCEWGMKAQKVYQKFFFNHSPGEMSFIGDTLASIEVYYEKRILMMHSSIEMLQRRGLDHTSVSNMTRWVQGTKGVDAIIYLREEAVNTYRVSFRSIILNVNRIALQFDGGGHKNASGCMIKGELAQIKEMLLEIFQKELKECECPNP